MVKCYSGCLHRSWVLDYRDARDAWEALRESEECMQMEDDEFAEAYPPPTLKQWMENRSD